MPFKFDIKEWNSFNSSSWWFPVKTGDIVIFPSSLIHSVETKQGNNTRISLAFNVFIKGTIGINNSLTELHL
jgi:ectoine hydroxylase-related dioxygenase (phytanoyl-CoA dioxygenase family)